MIEIRAARKDPETFRAALARKGAAELFDELMEADARWRELETRVTELRARTKLKGKPTPEQLEELRTVKDELKGAEDEHAQAAARRQELLDRVPNPPDPSAPDGASEDDAVEVKRWGETRPEARDHLDLGIAHGWIDMERAAKVSGSRFVYRMGDLALTELALYRFALDRLVHKEFVPVLPPVLVREEAMYGTGFLPTDEVNLYKVERDELYLVGTSEVPLAGLHMDEILEEEALPLRYAGYSVCFRREAGAAGKDTRGMFRVHQFDKVEMFVFTTAERSPEEHEHLLAIEEELVQELGLPYRVVNVAAGDLGASASKKYDIEAWFPGQQRYREITSTSNTTDYQARRLNVRTRRESGLETVHTLNGTAVTARALIAIIETFQDEDGSIAVPEPLVELGAPGRLGAEKTRV
ncbi:MAG TPA: serine--tRNA ligase [Gaiellaceae bacterium]|jgi:seryl-tRNA synthetase|nr:serine--tRNA ligase [Gaiellaceae bacterium]